MDDNFGILPYKLGQAKITVQTHNLIHYYDLNPIVDEANKLDNKTQTISNSLITNPEYYNNSATYLKILNLTKKRVERKINQLIPRPRRTKRGLINIAGSIFKAITGNLDAKDGIHYENLIKELQQNQNELTTNIYRQNSISLNVIENFNLTMFQMSKNMEIIEKRIKEIGYIAKETANKENMYFIKDILIQIINLYEIFDSILQDIETSITFAKLGTFHPSIMETADLFLELKKLEIKVKPQNLPLQVTLENTLEYEKVIEVESFILNGRITYLLKVPLTNTDNFDYYHLYSIPIRRQSQFKVVIPRGKYLILNQIHYSYPEESCKRMSQDLFICKPETLEETGESSPCETQLLNSLQSSRNCQQIDVTITRAVANRVDSSNKWILVIPTDKTIKLICNGQEEYKKMSGSFLLTVPKECRAKGEDVTITNDRSTTTMNEPITFPKLDNQPPNLLHLDLDFHLQELKLDELHKLRSEIQENYPKLLYNPVSTLLVYGQY